MIDSRYAMLARGEVEAVAAATISVFLYFVPTVIAVGRRAPNAASVFSVNLLFGVDRRRLARRAVHVGGSR